MEFAHPSWDSARELYRIRLVNNRPTLMSDTQSVIGNINSPNEDGDNYKELIKMFVSDFIKKEATAKWFSSRPREASILRRLRNKWITSSSSPLKAGVEWVIPHWRLDCIELTKETINLLWQLVELKETSVKIPSGFFAPSRPASPASPSREEKETVRQITVHPVEKSDLEVVFDIPYSSTAEEEDEEQKKLRQAVREARLRFAVAKLKKDRLLEKYFNEYGDLPEDPDLDSDSSGED
uniref:Uncharacterized protein n=1 Tax=viral metagenome TaxID=1070528 RepID=A0A6C0BK72_9ZZZZ